MRRAQPTDNSQQTNDADGSPTLPFDGGYLTDGETLFRIERTLVEDVRTGLLVELEDCATLELIEGRTLPGVEALERVAVSR